MPDPRSQILVHQLGDIPALGRLPQLASAVGRPAFKTSGVRSRIAVAGPTHTLATSVADTVLEPGSSGLFPRGDSTGGAMSVDERFDGPVDPVTLADRLRSIEGGSMATSGMTTPDLEMADAVTTPDTLLEDLEMAVDSPAVAPGGETSRSPAKSVPQTPGGPVGTSAGGAGNIEAPSGYSEIIERLAAQLKAELAKGTKSPRNPLPSPPTERATKKKAPPVERAHKKGGKQPRKAPPPFEFTATKAPPPPAAPTKKRGRPKKDVPHSGWTSPKRTKV